MLTLDSLPLNQDTSLRRTLSLMKLNTRSFVRLKQGSNWRNALHNTTRRRKLLKRETRESIRVNGLNGLNRLRKDSKTKLKNMFWDVIKLVAPSEIMIINLIRQVLAKNICTLLFLLDEWVYQKGLKKAGWMANSWGMTSKIIKYRDITQTMKMWFYKKR